MAATLPRNRLGFARWLFTADHPLTARVAVNRMWQEIFGTGLVKTADDFGSQGEPPSHPQLLDWLAVDFRESGWDVKRFYRQVLHFGDVPPMAHSHAGQSWRRIRKIACSAAGRASAWMPKCVRDYALAASGLLSPQIGGPSVKPYQPEGIWEAVAMDGSNTRFYKRDTATGCIAGRMYTFWKRSAPPASMDIFNAPTRENCTVRRERTNTPLQALVTMNDVQFVEAARVLAERAHGRRSADFDAPAGLHRDAAAGAAADRRRERLIARRSYDGSAATIRRIRADAGKLLDEGERKADPGACRPRSMPR